MAVNVHDYLRFTKDVDLVVELVPENIERAFAAMQTLDYRPLVPVTAQQFADERQRDSWIVDKGMTVLNFRNNLHRETPLYMFVSTPFDFKREYRSALVKPLGPVNVRFVSIPTLIDMKKIAGRTQDLIDIEYMQMRLDDHG